MSRIDGASALLIAAALGSCTFLYEADPAADAAPPPDAALDAAPACPAVDACPEGFFTGPCGCYIYPTNPTDRNGRWLAGATVCVANGAYPVRIESEAENLWLSDLIAERFWLGLNAGTGAENWEWALGGLLGSYNGFAGGVVPEPSSSTLLCASTMGGVWQITICLDELPILCEVDPPE